MLGPLKIQLLNY